jgi:hypothetical protein
VVSAADPYGRNLGYLDRQITHTTGTSILLLLLVVVVVVIVVIAAVRLPVGAKHFSPLHAVQTGPGTQEGSYTMSSGDSFPEGKAAGE